MVERHSFAKWLTGIVLVCGICPPVGAQEVGPATGALVAVGGAMKDPAILARFLELAGGPEAPIVVIPTAGTSDPYDQYWSSSGTFGGATAKLDCGHRYSVSESMKTPPDSR